MNHFTLHDLEDIVPEDPIWIWPRYIPRLQVSLLTGDPGAGKTHALLSLAGMLADGGFWPDQTPVSAGKALYFDAENGLSEIRRRFDAQGFVAYDNLRIAEMGEWVEVNDVRPSYELLGIALEDAIRNFAPTWVIIDPLVAFHSMNENTATEVRKIMIMLNRLAREHGLAITIVQHPRKSADALDPYSIRGSGDFIAAARAVLTVTRSKEPDVKALAVTKLNVAEIPPAQGFRIVDGSVEWVGEVELPKKHATKEDAAIELIQELLAWAPMPPSVIYTNAREEEIGSGTVDRAARGLGVQKV